MYLQRLHYLIHYVTIVSTNASDFLERLVSEMTHYMSS